MSQPKVEIPLEIKDDTDGVSEITLRNLQQPNFQATYRRGKFLGKGGFAKCYEFVKNGKLVYAGKIVPKTLLVKQHQKVKMANEIKLHRSLKHENIVQFIHSFEGKIFIMQNLQANPNSNP